MKQFFFTFFFPFHNIIILSNNILLLATSNSVCYSPFAQKLWVDKKVTAKDIMRSLNKSESANANLGGGVSARKESEVPHEQSNLEGAPDSANTI